MDKELTVEEFAAEARAEVAEELASEVALDALVGNSEDICGLCGVQSTSALGKPCTACGGRGKWTEDRRGKGDTFDGQTVQSVSWKCCVCKGSGTMPNEKAEGLR